MKIFVALLLVANIAGWVWQLGLSSTSTASSAMPQEMAYVQAGTKLTFLTEMRDLPRLRQAEPLPVIEPEPVVDLAIAPSEEVAAAVVVEPWCAVSAALPKRDDAAKLLADWQMAGGVGEIASDKEPVSSTWWVHLPPFQNEAAARVVLNELQQKKIDSYYMRSGELAGGISLGVFSREESARKVQAELRAKGYDTAVREIQRTEERSRLYLILESGDLENNEQAVQTLAKFGSIKLEEIPCK